MAINRDKPITTKPASPKAEIPANPPVTFSLEAVEKIVAEAMAKQRAELLQAMADQQQAKQATNGKSDVSTKNELQTIRVFKKAGFKDIQPRVNVLTFNKWLELGRRPLEGSKSLKVANLRLFHVSQTRPLSSEEKAAMVAEAKAKQKAAKGSAKIVPIGEGASPQA